VLHFDSISGSLGQGVHYMSLDDCARAFGWNSHRQFLWSGLVKAIQALQTAGCRAVIIDGSFVTDKELPNDWDAAFDPVGVDPAKLDPILFKHDDGRRAMKAKYLGDLFPWSALAGDLSGPIYREFFQKDRDGRPKGIVQIALQVDV
jgi:hypothetical protein